jgi:hypothetical protein
MGISLIKFEHEGARVGTLSVEDIALDMNLDTSKLSTIYICCRMDDQDPDGKVYQLQGFAPDEQCAAALCRDATYFYFGPVPFNCVLPHSAFRLKKVFPFKEPETTQIQETT